MLWLSVCLIVLCAHSHLGTASVPVIDISPLYTAELPLHDNLSEEYLSVGESIDAALRGPGSFAVTGHSLMGNSSIAALSAAHRLFRTPKDQLMQVKVNRQQDDERGRSTIGAQNSRSSEAMRGYISFGQESGIMSKFFEAKEGYSYGYGEYSGGTERKFDAGVFDNLREKIEESKGECIPSPLHGENVWPEPFCSDEAAQGEGKLSDWESACHKEHTTMIRALERVYRGTVEVAMLLSQAMAAVNVRRIDRILTALSAEVGSNGETHQFNKLQDRETLEMERSRWSNMSDILRCGDEISILRLFHYSNIDRLGASLGESNDRKSSLLGSSPHTDWGFLTIILQDSVGGLQFYDREKASEGGDRDLWVDVPARKDALVINGGDYLSLYSGGRYHSPVHRVLAPRGEDPDRYSFVLFHYPNYFTPLPTLSKTNMDVDGVSSANTGVGEHNTLLDGAAERDTVFFGDYMVQKWSGVFNSTY